MCCISLPDSTVEICLHLALVYSASYCFTCGLYLSMRVYLGTDYNRKYGEKVKGIPFGLINPIFSPCMFEKIL